VMAVRFALLKERGGFPIDGSQKNHRMFNDMKLLRTYPRISYPVLHSTTSSPFF
jgi:hypothetical protein